MGVESHLFHSLLFFCMKIKANITFSLRNLSCLCHKVTETGIRISLLCPFLFLILGLANFSFSHFSFRTDSIGYDLAALPR